MTRASPLALLCLLALVGLNLALALALWDGAGGRPKTPAAAAPWIVPQPQPQASVAARPLETFAQTLARPVLFKSRQPYVGPEIPAAAPELPPGPPPAPELPLEASLRGIVVAKGRRQALAAERERPVGRWLAEGGQIDGWTLVAIGPDSAKFQRDERDARLKLDADPQ